MASYKAIETGSMQRQMHAEFSNQSMQLSSAFNLVALSCALIAVATFQPSRASMRALLLRKSVSRSSQLVRSISGFSGR